MFYDYTMIQSKENIGFSTSNWVPHIKKGQPQRCWKTRPFLPQKGVLHLPKDFQGQKLGSFVCPKTCHLEGKVPQPTNPMLKGELIN